MVDHNRPLFRIDQPEPGFFRTRLIRGGPWVAARIYMRLGHLAAEINGQPADVERVWTSTHKITEAEYHALLGNVGGPDPNAKVVMNGRPVF